MNNRFNNSKMSLLKNKKPAKSFKSLFLHLFKLSRRQRRSKTPSKEQYAQLLKKSNTSLKLSQPSKAKDLKLNVVGLMAIPPLGEPAFLYFGLLKNIGLQLGVNNLQLSMGMSADFEDALAFDTNYIRVGTAIFGERQPLTN
jgi:uncharacterized pyridoxal phosphate-containing UPF0001 family protein